MRIGTKAVPALIASALCTAAVALPLGEPDPAFDGDGMLTIGFDLGGWGNDSAVDVVVRDDGSVVLGGWASVGTADEFQYRAALAAVDADGMPLVGFGSGGTRIVDFGAVGFDNGLAAMALRPDGGIVGVARVDTTTESPSVYDVGVFALHADGALDSSFDLDGRRQLDFGASDDVYDVALQPDGGIVGTGVSLDNATIEGCLLVFRLLPGGALDPGFGSGGSVCVDGESPFPVAIGAAIAVQPDGRVVVAGASYQGSLAMPNIDMLVMRLMPDGTPDPSFGIDGLVLLPFDQGGANADAALDVALLPDGRITLAGYASGALGRDVAVARLLPDGTLDPDFGSGGRLMVPVDLGGDHDDVGRALAIDDDGRIFIAGSAHRDVAADFRYAGIVVGLAPDGAPLSGFGPGGIRVIETHTTGFETADSNDFNAIALSPAGIYAVGATNVASLNNDMHAVRLAGVELLRDGFEDMP